MHLGRLQYYLIERIMEIRNTEDYFKPVFYENIFISFHHCDTYKTVTKHIRDIDFIKEIKDEHDIVRIFEYIIRLQAIRKIILP